MLMDSISLVQMAQLDLLIEVKRICNNNKIQYFLVGGTLIGAIRHNGFIPWDDDIDVGMLRSDYEKFIIACKKDLDKDYEIYDWKKDKASPLPFLKLKIKGTHYREYISNNTDMNDEIFIDIFPFDNAPNNKTKQRIQATKVYFIRKILLLRCGFSIDENCYIKKILYKMLKFISKILTVEDWKKICSKQIKKYNGEKTKNVVNMCGSYSYKKEMKRRSIVNKTILHLFEGINMSIPQNYNRYLKEVYGDYMKLPPLDQQVGKHGVACVDFGKYNIRYMRGSQI